MGSKKKLRTNESDAVWFNIGLKGKEEFILIRDGRVNVGPDKWKGKSWKKLRRKLEKQKTKIRPSQMEDPPF